MLRLSCCCSQLSREPVSSGTDDSVSWSCCTCVPTRRICDVVDCTCDEIDERTAARCVRWVVVTLREGSGRQRHMSPRDYPMHTPLGDISRVKSTMRTMNWRERWKAIGPGIITGAADNDPAGIVTYAQTGAAFGLGLGWLAAWCVPLMVAVQEASARVGCGFRPRIYGCHPPSRPRP